jgi:hypothetical protein
VITQGFAELEYGILCWMGAVDQNTPGEVHASVAHTGSKVYFESTHLVRSSLKVHFDSVHSVQDVAWEPAQRCIGTSALRTEPAQRCIETSALSARYWACWAYPSRPPVDGVTTDQL